MFMNFVLWGGVREGGGCAVLLPLALYSLFLLVGSGSTRKYKGVRLGHIYKAVASGVRHTRPAQLSTLRCVRTL